MSGSAAEFLSLAHTASSEMRVRGSRFIGFASPVEDEDGARGLLEARRRSHFDATHHCAAWRFCDGSWRAIDAGEPSRTAGVPILAAIDAEGLRDVAVVVTRYFGGTKLGVGGLGRAYGEAASAALAAALKRRGIPAVRLRIRYPYDLTAPVMRGLERFSAHHVEHGFVDGGREARVTFILAAAETVALAESLREQTAGKVTVEPIGDTVLYVPASR